MRKEKTGNRTIITTISPQNVTTGPSGAGKAPGGHNERYLHVLGWEGADDRPSTGSE